MIQLINPRRRMKESLVFLVFAVAGTCGGIFWTNSKDNDYPRIGRRSFYTSSSENSYPRIGRSGSPNTYGGGIERRASFFTQSDENTFPRIGRGDYHKTNSDGNDDSKSDGSVQETTGSPFSDSSEDSAAMPNTDSGSAFSLPAPILFFAWDANGDDSLSREEFVNGIANSRKRRRLV